MTVGIVAAKANSSRFPKKNEYILNDIPMFWHSVKPLLASKYISKVVVATNSDFIKDYSEQRGVQVIWRHQNASRDDDPLLSVLRFVYCCLEDEYDTIATIMANCPGHSAETVDNAIELITHGDFNEIRSFNNKNEESGLIVLKKKVVMDYHQISSHIGCIKSNVKEIHYREDLDAKY